MNSSFLKRISKVVGRDGGKKKKWGSWEVQSVKLHFRRKESRKVNVFSMSHFLHWEGRKSARSLVQEEIRTGLSLTCSLAPVSPLPKSSHSTLCWVHQYSRVRILTGKSRTDSPSIQLPGDPMTTQIPSQTVHINLRQVRAHNPFRTTGSGPHPFLLSTLSL